MANRTNNVTGQEATGWVGWAFFAAFMMMLSGVFSAIYGLVAIFNDQYFVATANHLLVLDVTQWGWVHLLVGLLVFGAGMSVLSGKLYGRIVGVLMASLSAILAFADLNLYPLWSIIVITIDILVIYALTAHGSELRDTRDV